MGGSFDLAARAFVLLASAVAVGVLAVMAAAPRGPDPRAPTPLHPPAGMLRGVVPGALVAFVLVAVGGAITGAGVVPTAGLPALIVDALQGLGIGILAACELLLLRVALRRPVAVTATAILVGAWAGAALALVSWLGAVGTVLVVLATGLRAEPRS